MIVKQKYTLLEKKKKPSAFQQKEKFDMVLIKVIITERLITLKITNT